MDASLAPLWPGSMNTTMPAMLEGAAVAIGMVGMVAVEAATSHAKDRSDPDTSADWYVHGAKVTSRGLR